MLGASVVSAPHLPHQAKEKPSAANGTGGETEPQKTFQNHDPHPGPASLLSIILKIGFPKDQSDSLTIIPQHPTWSPTCHRSDP